MHLLSDESTNSKLRLNPSKDSRYRSSILYLAPAESAGTGVNFCPGASEGCRAACLYTAGRGAMRSVQKARVRKSREFVRYRARFLRKLVSDLELLVRRQLRTGILQAVRLNGTSDLAWERIQVVRGGLTYPGVPQAFPELQFYDYTKLPERAVMANGKQWPRNYSLTFSQSEVNQLLASRIAATTGVNIAVVFSGELPANYLNRPVIDGTTHDMRFLDPRGVVVGLTAKGSARRDESGFVVDSGELREFSKSA